MTEREAAKALSDAEREALALVDAQIGFCQQENVDGTQRDGEAVAFGFAAGRDYARAESAQEIAELRGERDE
jgi:hypothetical protein